METAQRAGAHALQGTLWAQSPALRGFHKQHWQWPKERKEILSSNNQKRIQASKDSVEELERRVCRRGKTEQNSTIS